MSDESKKLRSHSEVKADKRAAALKANMQRRKGFVKSQKELEQEQSSESKEDAKSSSE